MQEAYLTATDRIAIMGLEIRKTMCLISGIVQFSEGFVKLPPVTMGLDR